MSNNNHQVVQEQQQHSRGGELIEQHDNQQAQLNEHDESQTLALRQRPQIEGIVADGGGPIVQWLLENYEIADGESLPRSTVYNHYLAHCRQLQMASVNAASFGKLIRSVFVGLKTRRLGTRGHSKYHYFGVRAKSHIRQELLQHQESASCSRDENSNHNTENTGSDTDSLGPNGVDCARLSGSANSVSNSNPSGTPTKRPKRENGTSGRRASIQNHNYGVQDNHSHQHHQYEASLANHSIQDTHQVQAQQDQNNHLNQHHHQQQQHQTQEQVINGTLYTYNGLPATNGHGPCHHFEPQPVINQYQRYDYTTQPISQRDTIDFRNYLGANWATLVDEHWPTPISNESISFNPKTLTTELAGELDTGILLESFESKYKSYYKRMVELLSELKFAEIEQLWQEFWRPSEHELNPQLATEQQQQNTKISEENHTNGHRDGDQAAHFNNQHHGLNVKFTFHLMFQLTSQPAIIDRINQIDYNLYQALETFLLPDILSPIPRPLAQHIRLFAKNIGPWTEQTIRDYSLHFVAEKSSSARAFGYSLRRCTSLNHLSTASRAIWEKRSSLAQMSMDLLRVDLRDIEHQVSLIGNCEATRDPMSSNTNNGNGNNGLGVDNNTNNSTINNNNNESYLIHQQQHPQQLFAMQPAQLIQNFLALLEDPYPANSWPDWCRNLVESRVSGMSLEEARNFVFKWNFYISLIIKELTLKSAPSLGSFQLIRLLFDEYMYYLVVSRLAQAQHKTLAQLMRPNSN